MRAVCCTAYISVATKIFLKLHFGCGTMTHMKRKLRTERMAFRLDADTYAAFVQAAERHRRDLSDLARIVIEDYVREEAAKLKIYSANESKHTDVIAGAVRPLKR